MTWNERITELLQSTQDELNKIAATKPLEDLEVAILGRKGRLADLMKELKDVATEERPKLGILANEVKTKIEEAFAKTRTTLEASDIKERLAEEAVDITEPGTLPPSGHLHLTTQAIREIRAVFEKAGFSMVRYPEIDWDWYAFESLNMPKDHPARDDWETFFVDSPVSEKPEEGKIVLVPHVSNWQARVMKRAVAQGEFPVRLINIGKCYRRQSDATHVPMFHQFEGMMIDKDVSITHLTGIIDHFVHSFFGPERRARLRPHHFRFTEPSFEVDISCGVCDGSGKDSSGDKCRMCKRGWHELGGAGMIHPNVLRAGGIDPNEYSGFAFGLGVERTFCMKEGLKIDDIRVLYKNDVRFLHQF
ncbi:phenylalanine--tRNA ligase subunit alpha [Patescibacteria group bacterium]|nr:phenylalanine--tRNA ligase subunit alpha [Patescibacteria group bacterium]